jgi:hypothetical protein
MPKMWDMQGCHHNGVPIAVHLEWAKERARLNAERDKRGWYIWHWFCRDLLLHKGTCNHPNIVEGDKLFPWEGTYAVEEVMGFIENTE